MRKFVFILIGLLALTMSQPVIEATNDPPGTEQIMLMPETIQINFEIEQVPATLFTQANGYAMKRRA